MRAVQPDSPTPPDQLSAIYDQALPEVYRYLAGRCGSTGLAEELTSATFVQAALSCSRGEVPDLSVAWLITVARNKLIDHWRREAVADRARSVVERPVVDNIDPWETVIDKSRANSVLAGLPPHYRAALTLRYLDDLSVPECAEHLRKSVRSTESLLVRARAAFRRHYEATGGAHD